MPSSRAALCTTAPPHLYTSRGCLTLICPLTCTVEATAKEEASELRSLPHQGLMVGCEGF